MGRPADLRERPELAYRPLLTAAARPATFDVRAVDEHGAAARHADRRRASADALRRQAGAPDADDARRGARGARDRLPAQPAARRAHRGHRRRAGRLGDRLGRDQDARRARGSRSEDGEAHEDLRLRPGHDVRRPDGRDRQRAAAARRDADAGDALRRCSSACACTRRSTSRPARCTAARSRPTKATARDILLFVEDVGRHNAVDAIAGQMWLDRIDGGDKIFYTTGRLTSEMVIKAAQMGIPFLVSRSGLTQMGYEIAREGRHDDDRPRDQQALPAVHRRRAVSGA